MRNTKDNEHNRKWLTLAAVGMGVFLATVDSSIVNIALPTLTAEFSASFAAVQWVVLAYLLTLTTLILSVGRLADIRGKKVIYTSGIIIFIFGSLLCGLSPTIYFLIASRVLQAIGASMTMALGMGIVTEAFPASERGKALGISGAIVSLGIITGPTIGGLLIDSLGWHWIFFVNLPVGVIGTVMAVLYIPDIRPVSRQRFDFPGAFTLLASLLGLLLGLSLGQSLGFGDLRVVALLTLWLIFLILFIQIERRVAEPMIDLHLFQNRLFSINLLTGFIAFVSNAGVFLLMPFYLENALGYDPRHIGLLLAIVPIAVGLTAPLAGTLSDRFGTRPITAIGMGILLSGYLSIGTLSLQTSATGYMLRFLPIGLGLGIFQSPNNSAVMGAASRLRLGVVSGMLAITRTLGQTTGVALIGAIWVGRITVYLNGSLTGSATNAPPAIQVAALQDTLHGITFLIALALILAIWAWVEERQSKTRLQQGATNRIADQN